MVNNYVFSIIDILPYYLVLLCLLCTYGSKLTRYFKVKYCFWLIFVLAAIRYGVAYDYFNYRDKLIGNVDEQELGRYEPFSRILMEISRHTHYQFFFAFGSFLTIYPIYKICVRYSIDPALSIIIYFLHPSLYLDGLGIVRNAIAFSLVLYAFVILQDEKKFKSILLIICAVMFHKSAVIGLLIYPLTYINNSRNLYIIYYFVSFLISALVASVVGAYADHIILLSDAQRYMEDGADRSGGGTMTIIINGLCLLNFLFWNRLSRTSAYTKSYLCSYCLGTCLWNIFLPIDYVMAGRFCSFFALSIILILPSYVYLFRNRRIGRRVVVAIFVLLFTSHFYININSYLKHPEKMSTIPYQTFFWHTDYRNLM